VHSSAAIDSDLPATVVIAGWYHLEIGKRYLR
jgi:hypothetical protein